MIVSNTFTNRFMRKTFFINTSNDTVLYLKVT